MNQLVFKNNDQVVTSSRNIARDFDKQHKHVLDAIDEIKGVAENSADLFYETTYIHEQNKQEYRQYLMNRDGFTLLVMGFTGKQAMKFKLDYMNAFNRMEQQLQQPNSRKLLLETALEHEKKIETIQSDVNYLKDTMRIDGVQEYQINRLGKKKVIKSLGGYQSPAYQELSGKVFARFWRDFKAHFMIPRYSELPKMKFDEAIDFIKVWQPDASTALEIMSINRQRTMQEVI